MTGAPGWLSFKDAIALVLAQRRECHTDREIGSWLVDLAASRRGQNGQRPA